MRIDLVSDLHLEFGDIVVPDGGDVLVLAGDIHVGDKASDWIDIALKRYDQVYYVLGNHEFYQREYHQVIDWWLEAAKYRENFEVLHNMVHAHGDVRFIGTTLWTYGDMPVLNDFYYIKYFNRLLTTNDTRMFHYDAIKFLEDALAQPWGGKTIVVTHHAPVANCVVPKYNGDPINCMFHANLEDIIRENDIAYWFHGHMHDSIYLEQHGTKIVCNPRGYKGYGSNTGFRNPFTVEI